MTNEQKAKELAHFILYDKSFESIDRNTYDKCMEMAEWKDEQYTKVLTKLIVELDELKHQVKSLLH